MAATKTPSTDEVFEQQTFDFGISHVDDEVTVRESFLKVKASNKRQWPGDTVETAELGQMVYLVMACKVEEVDFKDIGDNKVRRIHTMKPVHTTVIAEHEYRQAFENTDQTEDGG